MGNIATSDAVALSVYLSVCHMAALCNKAAERIEVLFGVETLEDPKDIVLDGGLDPAKVREKGSEGNFAPII